MTISAQMGEGGRPRDFMTRCQSCDLFTVELDPSVMIWSLPPMCSSYRHGTDSSAWQRHFLDTVVVVLAFTPRELHTGTAELRLCPSRRLRASRGAIFTRLLAQAGFGRLQIHRAVFLRLDAGSAVHGLTAFAVLVPATASGAKTDGEDNGQRLSTGQMQRPAIDFHRNAGDHVARPAQESTPGD